MSSAPKFPAARSPLIHLQRLRLPTSHAGAGEELRECRERLGLTQAELVHEVGVRSDTLSWRQRRARKIPKTMEILVLRYLLPQRGKAVTQSVRRQKAPSLPVSRTP
jgi:DNA-binding transcriptional regulator YiaG